MPAPQDLEWAVIEAEELAHQVCRAEFVKLTNSTSVLMTLPRLVKTEPSASPSCRLDVAEKLMVGTLCSVGETVKFAALSSALSTACGFLILELK